MNNTFKYSYLHYIVYETTCLVNNKTYIGSHATNNINDGYLGSGRSFRNAVKKYGKPNFVRKILFSFSTVEEMLLKEAELITSEYIHSKNTYNLVPGGRGGFHIIDIETWKKNLKVASENRSNKQPALGHTHSEETKKKMSKAVKNRPPISDETRKKLSESSTGRIGPWAGKTVPPELVAKRAEARRGKRMSEEAKANMRIAAKIREENKRKQRAFEKTI